jgi:hypothetical protein
VPEIPGEKLIIRLWETLVEKGIGSWLTPWQIKRDGRASIELRREELLMLTQAELEVADIRAGRKRFDLPGSVRLIPGPVVEPATSHVDDVGRAEPTLGFQAVARLALSNGAADAARGEINTSKAVIFAEDILSNDSQIPPERPIDEDWLFTWRDFAGKVSTEDLQRLWGSILAGEVKSPGSFSIRTLNFLRALSKSEAEQIGQLARYVVEGCIVRSQSQHLEKHGMSFSKLLEMQNMGLLSGVESIGLSRHFMTVTPDKFLVPLRSHGKVLLVEHYDATKALEFQAYLLTDIGAQLLGLGSFEPDVEYLRLVGKQIVGQGFAVQLADWEQISEKKGRGFNAEKIDA